MNGQDKAKALSRLNDVLKRAQDIKELSADSPDFKKWHRDATVAIRYAFGKKSDHIADFKDIHFDPWIPPDDEDWNEEYQEGLRSAEAMLKSMIEEIAEYWEDAPTASVAKTNNGRIFLMHGRDEAAQATVARFLEQLGLDPVILAEQPSEGKTIIEKFEVHAAKVGYAVALLTADDVGSRSGEDRLRPRARQNVIFELGYFVGCLGRKRVCALTKGDPEIPSDYDGVVYIPMESDAWKMELIKELKAAGFDVDANKVFD